MKKIVFFIGRRQLDNFSLEKLKEREKYRLVAVISRLDENTLPVYTKTLFDAIYFLSSHGNAVLQELDFAEVSSILQKEIMAYPKSLASIVCQDEANVLLAGKLRDQFNIKTGAKFKELLPFRNKILMKEMVQKNVRIPKFLQLKTKLPSYNELCNLLGQPLIIKPISAAGTLNVFKIESEDDYQKFSSQSKINFADFEAEEYIQGTFYHCDTVSLNRKLLFLECSVYSTPTLDFQSGKPFASLVVLRNSQTHQKIASLAKEALNALNMPDGCHHMEMFIDQNQNTIFIEVAARASGFLVTKVYEKTYGRNLLALDLWIQAGMEFSSEPIQLAPSAFVIYPTEKGLVSEIQTPKIQSEHEIKWSVSIGQKTVQATSNIDLGGIIFLWNKNYDILQQDLATLSEHNLIKYEPGNGK